MVYVCRECDKKNNKNAWFAGSNRKRKCFFCGVETNDIGVCKKDNEVNANKLETNKGVEYTLEHTEELAKFA